MDAILAEPGAPPCFEADITVKVVGSTPKVVRIKQYYITRDDEVQHFLDWIRDQKLKLLGYDTETSGIKVYDHQVATLQFGNPICADPRAYTFCVRSLSPAALAPVLAVISDKRITKLGQNIKFEGLYALHRLGTKMRGVIDTFVTELVIRAGLIGDGGSGRDDNGVDTKAYGAVSMAMLSKRYLNLVIDKGEDVRVSFYSTEPGQLNRRQLLYANGDVIYPFYIFEEQKKHIDDRKLRSILKLEFEFLPLLVEAELRGVNVDKEAWTELWHEACEKQRRAEEKLDRIFLGIQQHLFVGDAYAEESVRPVYMAGKQKPAPLNWGSANHVKWAIRQYCLKNDWPVEILSTKKQIFKAKLQHGQEWMLKKRLTLDDVCEDDSDPETAKGRQELPDFLLAEDRYCMLLNADKKTLKIRKIRGQLPTEFIDAILEYGEQKALVTTFGNDFLKKVRDDDGKVHTEFHQALAATGRVSSTPNLQNIPRLPRYRKCFKPSKGYKFVIADYSQIEPRISAQVSQDPVYLENYRANADLYIQIGEKLLGRKIIKGTPQGDEDRQAVKTIVLALAYRAGVNKLRDQLTLDLEKNVSWEEAKELHAGFLRECAGIKVFQDLCNLLADPKTGQKIWDDYVGDFVTYVTSPCGRHRFFPPWANNTYTESANHPIQGCSATITKAAAVLIQRYIDENSIDAVGINFVHDEIVYEVREDQADDFALVVQRLMEEAGKFYLPDVPCVAEFPKGSNGVVPFWTKELKEAA